MKVMLLGACKIHHIDKMGEKEHSDIVIAALKGGRVKS